MTHQIYSICSKFKNNKLKKIVNTYQLKYSLYQDNENAPGLGDYIRGCFSFYQLAAVLDLEFDMDMKNHPMSKYLQSINRNKNTNTKTNNKIDYTKVYKFSELELHPSKSKLLEQFINCLNSCQDDTYYFFSNAFSMFNINQPEPARQFIRARIQPNTELLELIDTRMAFLGLTNNKFSVIHIRCGDKFFSGNESVKETTQIANNISTIIENNIIPDKKYFIISDNNNLKMLMKYKYPQFSVYVTPIAHLGQMNDTNEYSNDDDNGLKNTLIEYFIMSQSNQIILFTSYSWGSGFSECCSKLFNIPYIKNKITTPPPPPPIKYMFSIKDNLLR